MKKYAFFLVSEPIIVFLLIGGWSIREITIIVITNPINITWNKINSIHLLIFFNLKKSIPIKPTLKVISGSWIAYSHIQIPGCIKYPKESPTIPNNNPTNGPYMKPTMYKTIQTNDNAVGPNEIDPKNWNKILKLNKIANIEIYFIFLNLSKPNIFKMKVKPPLPSQICHKRMK